MEDLHFDFIYRWKVSWSKKKKKLDLRLCEMVIPPACLNPNVWHKNIKFKVFDLPRQNLDLKLVEMFKLVHAQNHSVFKYWVFLGEKVDIIYKILKFVWWSETFKWNVMQTVRRMFFLQRWVETKGSFLCTRKSLSWHTALRIRRKSEKRDKEGRKMENGYRKSQDGLANKVSVKVDSRKITLPTWLILTNITFLFNCSFWIPISFPMVCTCFKQPLDRMFLNILRMINFGYNFPHSAASPEFLIPVADVACESGDTVTLRCKICSRPRATVTWRGPDNSARSNSGRYSTTYRWQHEL